MYFYKCRSARSCRCVPRHVESKGSRAVSVRIRPECVRLLQNLLRCNFQEVPPGQRDDNRQDRRYIIRPQALPECGQTGGSLLAVTAPSVEQAVFIGVDQHQTQVQIWIVQIHFNFIQFGNSIVKCSCLGDFLFGESSPVSSLIQ